MSKLTKRFQDELKKSIIYAPKTVLHEIEKIAKEIIKWIDNNPDRNEIPINIKENWNKLIKLLNNDKLIKLNKIEKPFDRT